MSTITDQECLGCHGLVESPITVAPQALGPEIGGDETPGVGCHRPNADLQILLGALGEGVYCVDDRGRLVFLNPEGERLLGWSEAELLGKGIHNIIHFQHPDGTSYPNGDCPVLRVFREGAVHRTQEDWFTRKDGQLLPVAYIATPVIRDGRIRGAVTAFRDISEEHALRQRLQVSKAHFEAIVLRDPDGILILDQQGIIRFVNPALEGMLGRTSDDLVDTLFGHPIIDDQVTEIEILGLGMGPGVAEMRVTETTWEGKPHYLVMLRNVTLAKQLHEQLQRQAVTDELTGLQNRRGFLHLAEQQLRVAQRHRQGVHLFFIDLDDMKDINDRWGHKVGDAALRDATRLIRGCFRDSDIIARLGGDEFAVLSLGGVPADAASLAMRLQQQVDAFNAAGPRPYRVLLSVGMAYHAWSSAGQPCDIDALLSVADQAMYAEKRRRKGNVGR